jgi:rhodanese-related sulfurtransferase
MGMSNVYHLGGGILAWKEAGGEVVEKKSRKGA